MTNGAPAPDPRAFGTFWEWFQATIAETGHTVYSAGVAAGLSAATLRNACNRGATPSRPTLKRVAALFAVDEAVLLAFHAARPVSPALVERGRALQRRLVERLGEQGAKDELARRAARMNASITPETRARIGALGGAALARGTDPEFYRANQAKGVESRKASGRPFKSEESRARHAENSRVSGRKAQKTIKERYGHDWHRRGAAAAAARLRTGGWYPCVFCEDRARPLYRAPWRTRQDASGRRPGVYHDECYAEWRRTSEMRDRSRVFGSLGQIRQRVVASGDAGLMREVDDQLAAELRHLRNPSAADRPPVLLDNRPLAIEMARLQHDGGMSAGEIALLAGLPFTGPSAKPEAGKTTYRLLRLGRALLGKERLPPGPRKTA